jgi:hypothetical protein
MIGKRKAPRTKHKKPRGEQLLDRIDNNPNDQEAWNELARESPTKVAKKKKPTRQALAGRAKREHGTLTVIPTAGAIENINRLTAGRGHCPEMFALIQAARLCPPMWGSNYLVDSPSRKSPSEILRFVDFPTSPESTPGANRQPVYRERIRECSIARPFPTGIASPKSRARESLVQPVRPHEAVESRSRAEGQQQYQKQCRDCHAPPICCPWSIQCW